MSASVLVVEDEFFIAQEIAETLEAAGFATLGPCASVSSALAALEGCESCAAAVLDASLRDVSSLPVAEALAARGIPYAVVTGFSAEQLPGLMASAPVLTKPVMGEALVTLIRSLIAADRADG